jgi:[ribosomal protein S5]-alanine N-acetyltransferase
MPIDDGFELHTARLRLRPYRVDDVDAFHAIVGDPETMRYYPAPCSREGTRLWIEKNVARYREDGFGLLMVEDVATGELVGSCGPAVQVVDDVREVELGWHVRRDRWGEGIAPEAAGACRDWAFGSVDADHLIALVRPVNEPSKRVAEKIGMTVWKETLFNAELRWPHLVYRIDRWGGRSEPGRSHDPGPP